MKLAHAENVPSDLEGGSPVEQKKNDAPVDDGYLYGDMSLTKPENSRRPDPRDEILRNY